MNEPTGEKRIGDYLIEIYPDMCPDSPREWDNLGTMAYKHRNYTLGEEEISDPIDWLTEKLNLSKETVHRIAESLGVFYYSDEVKEELEERFMEKYVALPTYLYDHSGITMKTAPFGCRWDSGQCGYIYVSKAKVREEFGVRAVTEAVKKRALDILRAEVKTFDQYISGDVYGFKVFKIRTCNLGEEHKEEVDSCWGYYGVSECMESAEEVVQHLSEHVEA